MYYTDWDIMHAHSSDAPIYKTYWDMHAHWSDSAIPQLSLYDILGSQVNIDTVKRGVKCGDSSFPARPIGSSVFAIHKVQTSLRSVESRKYDCLFLRLGVCASILFIETY
eukprot:GHVO01016243.1.p1 GENE.GHVO01016243.1~~GHVO01016243.1.p1  ORF type:complete len:110 (+),score=13.33 GHVO01016243.1:706-1035(+)